MNDAGAVTWTEPKDFQMDVDNAFRELQPRQREHFLVGPCDGSVHQVHTGIDPSLLKAHFTRDAGERLSDE